MQPSILSENRVCSNENIVSQHNAKVYGMASAGSPPMSVPHFDLRVINGKKTLLFGPYAGFTFKFLKTSINVAKIYIFYKKNS